MAGHAAGELTAVTADQVARAKLFYELRVVCAVGADESDIEVLAERGLLLGRVGVDLECECLSLHPVSVAVAVAVPEASVSSKCERVARERERERDRLFPLTLRTHQRWNC